MGGDLGIIATGNQTCRVSYFSESEGRSRTKQRRPSFEVAHGCTLEQKRSACHMATDRYERKILENGEDAIATVREEMAEVINKWNLPSTIGGAFVGAGDFLELSPLGFDSIFMNAVELQRVLDSIINDLLTQSGVGWTNAQNLWQEDADQHWPKGVVTCILLQAMLVKFSNNAEFYF